MATSDLLDLLGEACAAGDLSTARETADELARPHRKGADYAVAARHWPALSGYSTAQLQPLEDRIAVYNSRVA